MTWLDLVLATGRAAQTHLGGQSVVYAPQTGSPVTVKGIFDAAWADVSAGENGVTSVGPRVFLQSVDLPTDPEAELPTLTISALTYSVREVRKDGEGGVYLFLHLV